MSIETRFDIPFVARLALREKQIQQNYRPIIGVHKWFARRPGSLFRALVLAEFGKGPLHDRYFAGNDFSGRKVADPFMGGGTPLIEANRLGCDVLGLDINPMAAWIVREAIEGIDLDVYQEKAKRLLDYLHQEVGHLYLTDCAHYADKDVPLKYGLWVKTIECEACGRDVDLFPGYLVAKNARHPKNVLVCADCGELNEVEDRDSPGLCRLCRSRLSLKGPAGRGRCPCSYCSHENTYPRAGAPALKHRLFAIEYYNPRRKDAHKGRFFKKPDTKDLQRIAEASERLTRLKPRFIPEEEILAGDETNRLHRWGYRNYREMFSHRQLLGLDLGCRFISAVENDRVRRALATNLSDLLRYQNLLCRYDTWALKSLDIFSVHGFPVGHVQCESNLLGIVNGKGVNVGSGGWTNIIEKYTRAKRYCESPFEVKRTGSRNVQAFVPGERIGEYSLKGKSRNVTIKCADAASITLKPQSLDAVFTDPPYFGNVQYGELMDFCYVWLRRLMGSETEGFKHPSTRTDEELTGNVTRSWGLDHFTRGLGRVYGNMAAALKPGAPLVFTYHHNKLETYCAVGVAILDSGLTCSASLPCPAEMGGSIHIHGTSSSIVDTVFVCRTQGETPRSWLFQSAEELAHIVAHDLAGLAMAGREPTTGDTRCIIFGHLTRMAVWNLVQNWETGISTEAKLECFARTVYSLADPEQVIKMLEDIPRPAVAAGSLFSEMEFATRKNNAIAF